MTTSTHWKLLQNIAIALIIALAAPLAQAAAAKERVNIIYKAGAKGRIVAALASANGRMVHDFPEVNAVTVELPSKAVKALQRNRNVTFLEKDSTQYAFAISEPSDGDPYFTGQQVPYGIPLVQADVMPLHDSLAGNRTLCVVDSGIDANHPDLAGLQLAGINLSGSGFWYTDEGSHGTHVTGTIAAINNLDTGVVGVMPNQTIDLKIVKVFDASGSTSSSTVAYGMLICGRAGANVISMSLGGPVNSYLQAVIANYLYSRGVLLVAAAGNAGTSATSYPAGLSSVMSVAAVDQDKQWASFSQFNSTVEISGPGVSVLSTVPVGSIVDYLATVAGVDYPALLMEGTPAAVANGNLYDFGLGEALDFGASGMICLIQRGNISFSDKVLNCQNSGGLGAIIYNNVPGPLSGTLGNVITSIPSVGVSDSDGAAMLADAGSAATVDTLNGVVSNYDYDVYDGTSMATPHVSAVAALVWSYFPGCTNVEIRRALDTSAEDLFTAGWDSRTGFGLVQALAAYNYISANPCAN